MTNLSTTVGQMSGESLIFWGVAAMAIVTNILVACYFYVQAFNWCIQIFTPDTDVSYISGVNEDKSQCITRVWAWVALGQLIAKVMPEDNPDLLGYKQELAYNMSTLKNLKARYKESESS
jgi:hypothetical protein